MTRKLVLPADFPDYAWEVEAKGVFWDARVRCDDGSSVEVTFYDPARLEQDVSADLADGRPFSAKRVLVVERLTVENMRSAVSRAASDFFT